MVRSPRALRFEARFAVTEDAVEVLAIVPESKAAKWLERYGQAGLENEESDS